MIRKIFVLFLMASLLVLGSVNVFAGTASSIVHTQNASSTGSLSVTEKVTGIMGDTGKLFKVHVVFAAPQDEAVGREIRYIDDGTVNMIPTTAWSGDKVTRTITVKDGETVTFTNIPYGVTYTVTEQEANQDGYATSYIETDADEQIESANDTVTITDARGGSVPTGILMKVLPVISVLLAIAALLLLTLVIRRRRFE